MADTWKEGEYKLRRREVGINILSTVIQGVAVAAALVASLAAAYAARQAGRAVSVAEAGNTQHSRDDQLSTAITAIGGDTASERVAGVTLLRLNVAERVASAAGRPEQRDSARGAYITALDVLANYLRGNATEPADAIPAPPSTAQDFGLGHGKPNGQQPPFDAVYAGDQLRELLKMAPAVKSLDGHKPSPAIDLSKDELYGMPWSGISFDSLNKGYLRQVDLRMANLANSNWGNANLQHAYLQCANLTGADLRKADLTGADLRGANVEDANFAGNKTVAKANTADVYGKPIGLAVSSPQSPWDKNGSWNQKGCAEYPGYWDGS